MVIGDLNVLEENNIFLYKIKYMKEDSINILEKVIHFSKKTIAIHESSPKYITIYRKSLIKHILMISITIQSLITKFITMFVDIVGSINKLDCSVYAMIIFY